MIGVQKSKGMEYKELLEQARLIFIEIKANYAGFLSSLKYENFSDKKKSKLLRRKMEDASGFQNWELNVYKNFSFQQELMSQNKGYVSFVKLLENIKTLEWINNELAAGIFLQQKIIPGQQQIHSTVQMLRQMQKHLLTFLQFSKPGQKESKNEPQ